MRIVFAPSYQFGSPVGPRHNWFAWFPVRKWYGRWAWLEVVGRQRIGKHDYLDGPDWEFWCYMDADK